MRWPQRTDEFTSQPEGLRALFNAMVESYDRGRGCFSILIDYWSVVIRDGDEHRPLFLRRGTRFYDAGLELIASGIRHDFFRSDAEPLQMARVILAGVEGLRLQRAIGTPSFDLGEPLDAFISIVLKALVD